MDNFKKPKKTRFGSVDGFVHPQNSGNGSLNSLRAFDQYHSSSKAQDVASSDSLRIGEVGDFHGMEGFQPSAQAPILQPGVINKPAEIGTIQGTHDEVLDKREERRPKIKRRGFLHFRRKQKPFKKPSKHPKLKKGLKIASSLAVLAILVFGGLGLKAYLTSRNILKGGGSGAAGLTENVDPSLLKGEGDGRVNILLLGKGGPGHDGPDLTDTILVASIDPVAKEIALLSIPRDLWVQTPTGGASKINAIYANAKSGVLNNYTLKQQTDAIKQQAEASGIKAIEATVTKTMGIPIHYFGMVDFIGFRDAINTVGGIDIDVKTELYDTFIKADNGGNPLIAAVGPNHFDGKRALLYAQSRHGSNRGDFDRTERQREVIVALKEKIFNLGTFANPLKVSQLIDNIGNHVSTDFSLNEIMRVYTIMKGIDSSKIASIGLADPPNNYVTTGNQSGQSVVVPRAGTFEYAAIQSYIRNTLRDSYLKSENASLTVLNGTATAGLATTKSNELKSYGYNVTTIGDAPTHGYTKTILVDMTKGIKKYTKSYLEKRLGVTATTTLPDSNIVPGTADFVIIVGNNDSASQ